VELIHITAGSQVQKSLDRCSSISYRLVLTPFQWPNQQHQSI